MQKVGRGLALLPLLLCGCAGLFPSIADYDPVAIGAVVKVTDAKQYAADLAECKLVAAKYSEPLSAGNILSSAGTGAAQNAPAAVLGGPLVVAVGAAGGASSSALESFDILSTDKMAVLGNCLREDSRDDHAFHFVGR